MSEQQERALLILGAGYTGRRLAEFALESGWEVTGTTRKATTRDELEEMGANALYWDIAEDELSELTFPGEADTRVAVYSIPTLFEEWKPAEDGIARHVRPVLDAMQHLEELGTDRFVYISSTSVYGDHDGEWCTEESERRPTSPYGKMRKEIEDAVMDWEGSMEAVVCRAVGIYGPGRTLDRWIRKGRYKLVDGGKKPGNRIHVDDLAGITLAICEGYEADVADFIATDGNPVPVHLLIDWMVDHLDIERPEEVTIEEYAAERGPNAASRWTNVCRYRNDRVVDVLAYRYRFPDVLSGYAAIFGIDA